MPTDTLVDVVTLVKLVNVRKSRAEEAGKIVALLLDDKDLIMWDKAELGPLQLIGDMAADKPDGKERQNGAARQIKEKPVEEPEPGVSVPSAAKDVKSASSGKRHYNRLSEDGKKQRLEDVVKYVNEHPGTAQYSMEKAFGLANGSLDGYIEPLVEKGRIHRQVIPYGKDGKLKKMAYYPIGETPVQAKPPEKVEIEIAETKNLTITEPSKEPAPAPSKEPIVSKQIMESFAGMRTGHNKDIELKATILKVLSESPGIGVQKISDKIRADARKTRTFLIELEEEKKIDARDVVLGCSHYTGYYLKAAVPKEAC